MKEVKLKLKLTEAQQRLLLQTHYDDLVKVFKGIPRRRLLLIKEQLQAKLDPSMLIDIDAERASARAKVRSVETLYTAALDEKQQLERELATVTQLRDNLKTQTMQIKSAKAQSHEATAVALASDWHAEEKVDGAKMNYMNAYDIEEFKKRASKFFENLVKLVKKEQASIVIKNLVLWLGGDFFTGIIHLDTSTSNQKGLMDAAILVQQTIASGIKYLLKELPNMRLTLPCSMGNHSRVTQKQMIKTERENSVEFYMYHTLAGHFADDDRVTFILPHGYHTYLDVHGYLVRFHHGHAIQYGGGVGGITIPTNKKIAQWNKARKAYLDCFGHFHQKFDGENFIANGSLIGYNEYAINIGASYEPPQQVFFLIDSLHGKTVVAPILLREVNPMKSVKGTVL